MPLHKPGRWMGSRVKPNGEPQITHLCQLLLSREKPAPPCQMRIRSVQEFSPLSQGLLGCLTQQGVISRCWLKTMQQLHVLVEPSLAGCLVLTPLLSLGVSKKTLGRASSHSLRKAKQVSNKQNPCFSQLKQLTSSQDFNDQFLISMRKY